MASSALLLKCLISGVRVCENLQRHKTQLEIDRMIVFEALVVHVSLPINIIQVQ